jgi:hypothetical protein
MPSPAGQRKVAAQRRTVGVATVVPVRAPDDDVEDVEDVVSPVGKNPSNIVPNIPRLEPKMTAPVRNRAAARSPSRAPRVNLICQEV